MSRTYSDTKEAYKKILESKIKYGTYHKALFHIHTPQSHDYQLKSDWKSECYQTKSELDMYDLCIDLAIFPNIITIDNITLDKELVAYDSKKEFLSFLILADALIKNKIEIVVVTDHNTIKGINKLEVAIKQLCDMKDPRVHPKVIGGIEISCADRIHVVGIFDQTSQNCSEINKWLSEYLLDEKDGSYCTSLDVMKFIKGLGGIPYIAHINTSAIFSEKKYLSGAYKIKLFGSKYLELVGVSDFDKIIQMKSFLRKYKNERTNFIIDNDAHYIDILNQKFFWIKGSKVNYSMVYEALLDYEVSVSLHEENVAKQYIEGIYIELPGFLSDSSGKNAFYLRFSESLNCLIGGRGTGKSTVIEMMEYVLSQRCSSERLLDFVCAHGNTYILYKYYNKEYLIEMLMPFKENINDNILRYFGQNPENRYQYKYRFMEFDVEDYARSRYLSIFEVSDNNGKLWVEPVKNKKEVLRKLYDTGYSVNNLVKTASSEEINDFIFNVLFENKTLDNPANSIKIKSKSGLDNLLNKVNDFLLTRQKKVESVINPFNATQKYTLRIVYSQNEVPYEPNISEWIFGDRYKEDKFFNNYNIRQENIVSYILNIYDQIGIFPLLKLSVEKSKEKDRSEYPLLPFMETYNQELIEQGIKFIDEKNEKLVIDEIFNLLVKDSNINKIIQYIKDYVGQIENFSLEFNINNSVSSQNKETMFKDVRELSLGQKVVAMIDFILGYSEYSGDFRPLIIDQPEDNLDSQYIYNNLVNQLRHVKEKRQVIIATHNATIVTNSMADQVCVMKSNGIHGWVEAVGYPGEKRIKTYILNYLEGGIESFKHKIAVYSEALK